MEDVMVKLLQVVVNWLWAILYPASRIDPVQREWMRRRRELRARGLIR
jgi:hypothetical protein